MPQLDILCHQIKSPVPRMGYILLSCWPKGDHDPCPTNIIAQCQGIGCSPQPDGKGLFLKMALMSSNMEKMSWCPTNTFTPDA